jgi:cysteinyl-tRNA synthetase
LGNFVTIHELFEGWDGYAWPGQAIRFNMLRTYYREPIDWTAEGLDSAHKTLWDWAGGAHAVNANPSPADEVLEPLSDDLNTPQAIAALHALAKQGRFAELKGSMHFLGFSLDRNNLKRAQWLRPEPLRSGAPILESPRLIENESVESLIAARNLARKAKNFQESDRIRDELAKMGVVLKDTKDGTTWEIAR